MEERVVLPIVAEDLCLAFVNTRYWRGEAEPTETLCSIDDLLAWCETTAGLPPPALAPLRQRCRADPTVAEVELATALLLRETMNRLFGALAVGTSPAAGDLEALAASVRAAPARDAFAAEGGRYGWAVPAQRANAALVLAPVIWSAADLLAGPRLPRLRRCTNDRCLYLFVDTSRAGNRRWCAMSACGNRAKARRHYHRHKRRAADHD